MSGKGGVGVSPPARTLLTILDQAFVDTNTGKLTPWAGQFLTRLISFLGPVPPPGTPGAGMTVTGILTNMLNEADEFPLLGADAATQQAIAALRQAVSLIPPLPMPTSDIGGGLSGVPFSYTVSWGAGAVAQAGTIEIDGDIRNAGHILGVVFDNGVAGGTIDGNFQINGTSITGLSAVVNNGPGTASATGLNATAPGNGMQIVLGSPTGTLSDGAFFSPFGTYD
jgi:hypothetical protein